MQQVRSAGRKPSILSTPSAISAAIAAANGGSIGGLASSHSYYGAENSTNNTFGASSSISSMAPSSSANGHPTMVIGMQPMPNSAVSAPKDLFSAVTQVPSQISYASSFSNLSAASMSSSSIGNNMSTNSIGQSGSLHARVRSQSVAISMSDSSSNPFGAPVSSVSAVGIPMAATPILVQQQMHQQQQQLVHGQFMPPPLSNRAHYSPHPSFDGTD
jgi:hypothetical protein